MNGGALQRHPQGTSALLGRNIVRFAKDKGSVQPYRMVKDQSLDFEHEISVIHRRQPRRHDAIMA